MQGKAQFAYQQIYAETNMQNLKLIANCILIKDFNAFFNQLFANK